MKRICPYCKYNLTVSSVYFCEFCGNSLPENLYSQKADFKRVQRVQVKEKKHTSSKVLKESIKGIFKVISLKSIVVGVLLGVSLSITFFLFFQTGGFSFMSFNKKPQAPATTNYVAETNSQAQETEEEKVYIEMGLGLLSGPFGENNVYEYVPFDTPFYIEFNDVSTLEPYFSFLGGDFFTLEKSLQGKLESNYSAFYLSKGLNNGWVVLAFLTDENIEVREYKTIFTNKIDNVLIISPKASLIDEVLLAKSGVSKNLSQHPMLISIKPTLPPEGQIFILKTSRDGDVVSENLARETLSEDLKSVIEKFNDMKTSYLVIK